MRLHPGKAAFKLSGDDLARQTIGRHIRRHVERFDHQRAIMRGGPQRQTDETGQRQKHERCSELEGKFENVADVTHAQRPVANLVFAQSILDLDGR